VRPRGGRFPDGFIDYSTRLGTLPERVDVNKYLQRF